MKLAASLLVFLTNGSWHLTKAKKDNVLQNNKETPKDDILRRKLRRSSQSKKGAASSQQWIGEKKGEEESAPDVGILSFLQEQNGSSQDRALSSCSTTCLGPTACVGLNRTLVDSFSCLGKESCNYYDRGGYLDRVSLTIGQHSCSGEFSCFTENVESARHVEIGDWSCLGYAACGLLRTSVGDRSCVGEKSCYRLNLKNSESLGPWSCIGNFACANAGFRVVGVKVTIGARSCWGENACKFDKQSSESGEVSIGSGSCLCDNCCSNLMAGSFIGDCQCNSSKDNCGNAKEPVIRRGNACAVDKMPVLCYWTETLIRVKAKKRTAEAQQETAEVDEAEGKGNVSW